MSAATATKYIVTHKPFHSLTQPDAEYVPVRFGVPNNRPTPGAEVKGQMSKGVPIVGMEPGEPWTWARPSKGGTEFESHDEAEKTARATFRARDNEWRVEEVEND